jgi:hypothetical protein
MSIAALPYAVLLLLAEFAIGAQLSLFAAETRGTFPQGLLKLAGGLVLASTALAFWQAVSVPAVESVGGFPLAARFLPHARVALGLMLTLSLLHGAAIWRTSRRIALFSGVGASLAAIAALGLLSAVVQQPTWSLAGTIAGLLTGGLALGGVTLAMTLGHWYLVTPRLPEQPLNEMTLGLLLIIVLQVAVLAVAIAAPAQERLAAFGIPLGQNPAFWLRAGVGLALGGLLTFMAWQSSLARGMMSATGLLYLATGAVAAGQALACALLFTTGIPS